MRPHTRAERRSTSERSSKEKATLPDGTKLDEIVPVRFKFDDGRLSMQSLNVGGGRYPEILRLNADGELFDENRD